MAKKETNNKKPSDREKKYQKKVAQERKKLQKIVSSPMNALFYISLIVSLITFIYSYFSISEGLISALITSFFGFATIFFGFGIGMILYFHFKSEKIKQEYEEKLIREQVQKENLEMAKYKSELTEIENIEKELTKNKAKTTNKSEDSTSKKKKLSDEEAYLEEVLNSEFKP